jgi:CRISPR-associated endonuclease/helicase Cas3
MTLTAKQFPDFYREVNGYEPFPWQARLVEEIDKAGGLWPAVLDLPTSAGKTSALDAAVFLLALQAGRSVHERTAAIRTFFVVDRRIVVDEAAEKARKLAKRLNAAEIADPVLKTVANQLRQFGGEKPLHVSVLRGGMYRDGSWAESPTQPTICLSTVDQVGSRLLFRGYGVSPYQRTVHAGLVGNDSLILVDEAHLSRPFIETLKAVEFYRSEDWAERPVKTPFQVVVMSATAGDAAAPVVPPTASLPGPITLQQADRDHPLLKPRLGASKLARLEEVKGGSDSEDKNRREFAEAVTAFARELAAPIPAPKKAGAGVPPSPPVLVVGIVVNRVDTARRVYRNLLAERDATAPQFDVILLTGRVRPYDRDRLLVRWFQFMEANRQRPVPPSGQLFVVATQTVEVGANLSFDALVTEAAPLDALRQRFGRLDRLGLLELSQAVIVARKDQLKLADPVYGKATKETWDWLSRNTTGTGKNKRIDFGIDALAKRLPADLASLSAPFSRAPVMMPSHVDNWVQTSIPPVPDPDPALFLHGPQSGPADVSVVWRADVTKELFEKQVGKKDAGAARQVVGLVPPVSMEALSLPTWQVQSWLRDRASAKADLTDLEGEGEPEPAQRRDERKSDPFLIWKGPDRDDGTTASDDPKDIHPGNTIIVPSTYGGCDEFGWNPDHIGDVIDIADDCSWRAKRRPLLRVHRGSQVHRFALAAWGLRDEDVRTLTADLTVAAAPDEETGDLHKRAVLGALRVWPGLPDWLNRALENRTTRKPREVPYPTRDGVVVVMPVQRPESEEGNFEGDAPADDEGNSFIGAGDFVSLGDHCRGVRTRVEGFALSIGLAQETRELLSRAAGLHDAGKADPRFQTWLYGSEAEAARNQFEWIAKSQTEGSNAAEIEAARIRARWPKGGRHEAGSVLLARGNPETAAGLSDPELFEYLLGTHHGRGRPQWPFVEADEPLESPGVVRVDLCNFALSAEFPPRPETALAPLHCGWADLFWKLVRRYGYWGLAYLETLLVLADHRQSEAERNAEQERL